jgi:hypothetical protein
MTAGVVIFVCSICGEPASEICVYCTKDACANHRCDRCKRCSDCCECEVPLSAAEATPEAAQVAPEIEQSGQPEVLTPEAEAAPESAPSESTGRTLEPREEILPSQPENPIF